MTENFTSNAVYEAFIEAYMKDKGATREEAINHFDLMLSKVKADD